MSEDFCPYCHRPEGAGHTMACLTQQTLTVLDSDIQAGAKFLGQTKPPVSILQEAEDLVNGDRHEAYGAARDNFTHWRDMCRATGRPGLKDISAEDLAVVMICLKVCRNTVKYKRDSTVDGAAYFELWDQVRGL